MHCAELGVSEMRSGTSSSSSSTKKQEAIVSEFNNLLSSQMTAQRQHFDELRQDIEKNCGLEISEISEKLKLAEQKADAVQRRLDLVQQDMASLETKVKEEAQEEAVAQRQRGQLEALNQRLAEEQKAFEESNEAVHLSFNRHM